MRMAFYGGPFDGEAKEIAEPADVAYYSPDAANPLLLRNQYLYRRAVTEHDQPCYWFVDLARDIADDDPAIVANEQCEWHRYDNDDLTVSVLCRYALTLLRCPLCGRHYVWYVHAQRDLESRYIDAVLDRNRAQLRWQRYVCPDCLPRRLAHQHPEQDILDSNPEAVRAWAIVTGRGAGLYYRDYPHERSHRHQRPRLMRA